MGGKATAPSGPNIGPRGPVIAGPAGPSVPAVARLIGPLAAAGAANRDSFKNIAAPVVGTIAGLVSDYFVPGTGYFASKAADRTVREQVNVVNGRPFFEGMDNAPGWGDVAGIIGSGIGASGATGSLGAGVTSATGSSAAGTVAGQVAGTATNVGLKAGANYLNRTAPIVRKSTYAPAIAPIFSPDYEYRRLA